ncbi:hypothetical protein [Paludibacterium denitrificans]|uniref:Uncharacterized protein n=1 Tax=Paludibacterium denitrificans TaxID=2675226 RepID=A0A844G803_9NEIS|nr:hypothetical protein [Paludibacterium denitrificans]MTD32433.1 hypothetical protein [Paludibacterium denitrificans]
MNTDNVVALITPGPQRHLARFHIALGDPSLIYGQQDIASITFRREGNELALYHMALGISETRRIVLPGDEIQLQVDSKMLLIIVRAVSATHVLIDA